MDPLPFPPQVHVALKSWVTVDGFTCVSSSLLSEVEIDSYVEALKADLDAVARRAKVALRRAKELDKHGGKE